MSELADLERRITTALERISRGVETLQAAPVAAPDGGSDALQAELDEERTANAQLNERVRALKEKQDTTIAGLQAQVAALRARAEAAEAALAGATASHDLLRSNNAMLRAAAGSGGAGPDQLNTALEAELSALKSARNADRAELDGVLAELEEIMEGKADA